MQVAAALAAVIRGMMQTSSAIDGGRMRGLKLVVALLGLWILGLTLFAYDLHLKMQRSQKDFGALTGLLEIHSWELPMAKDDGLEWSFEMRDYKESKAILKGADDWMDPSKKARIVFMPTGEDTIHRFWLVQTNGTSSGRTRLDVCDDPDELQHHCDAGQFEYSWLPIAERIEDGKTYVICELSETFPPKRRKQLILHLVHFRLEDIQKDEELPQRSKSPTGKHPVPTS